MSHPLFEIVTTTLGVTSIRNKAVNEIMHNPVGPWAEANALYVEQSQLAKRLREFKAEEFVLYDVGLGAAANSLAVLHTVRAIPRAERRAIHLVSFEKDLELLRFALKHSAQFAHFSGFEKTIEHLLEHNSWSEEGIRWTLHPGDFLETMALESQKPHLIYFDPYSPKMNYEMWSTACFRSLLQKSRYPEEGGTVLYTYSQATPIRAALLMAGFFVGHGRPSGPKEETTQASTDLKLLDAPLGAVWFKRWQNSHTQFPYDALPEDQEAIRLSISNHFQFRT